MKFFVNISMFLLLAQVVYSQRAITKNPTPHPSIWETSSPEQQGLSSARLNEMFNFVRAQKIPVHSVQIIRHNKLILDAYFYPYTGQSRHEVASVTKSITSTLVGIAIDKKFISGVSEPAFGYFPGYDTLQSLKKTATIENLLTMQSGLDCGTNLSDPSINVDKRLEEIRQCENWIQCILQIPLTVKPGQTFAYCNANCHLLSSILQKATGKSMSDFGKEQLFDPIGIRDYYWPADPQGVNYGWADLQLHPYDMLKIGQLMLQKGKWKARQLVSKQWLQIATKTHVTQTGGSDKYGYYWWMPGGNYPDVFEAVGRGGQRITVWPSNDMVIVFTGGGFNTSDLIPFILKAIESQQSLPENRSAHDILKKNIADALVPPSPLSVTTKPLIASQVEGRQYALAANSLGFSSIRVKSNITSKSIIVDIVWNNTKVSCEAGLDGVPRFSYNPLVRLDQACTAEWKDDQSLEIRIDMVGAINNYTLKCRFDDDAKNIAILASERTGLNNELIMGRQY